jgi:O-antigen/teichoic acid export membrane protein
LFKRIVSTFKNSPFARVVGFFAASNAISTILNMLAGLISARLLGPNNYGLFNSISLIQGYASFAQVGVLNGLNRELPFYFGKGKIDRAHQLCSTAKYWAILLGFIFFVALSVIGVYHLILQEFSAGFTWITVGITIFLFFNGEMYLKITYRTNSDFSKLSKFNIIKSVINFASIVFVIVLGYFGFLIRAVIVPLVDFFMMYKNRPVDVKSKWSTPHFKHLLKIGIPIYLVGYLDTLWATVNATLIVYFLGSEQLGLYAVANLAFGTLSVVPNSLNQILYPKLAREYGEGSTVSKMLITSVKSGALVFFVLLPLAIIAWFVLPYMIGIFLPKFAAGVDAAKFILLMPLVMSLAVVDNIYIVIKKQSYYGFCLLTGMLAFVIILFIFNQGVLQLKHFALAFGLGKLISLILSYSFLFFNKKLNAISTQVLV